MSGLEKLITNGRGQKMRWILWIHTCDELRFGVSGIQILPWELFLRQLWDGDLGV